jgi:DHA3 family macrolide efflux protein-like MFS transporter
MAHPFVGLLKDRAVAMLWAGQSGAAVGGELFAIAVIWLAIEAAGSAAALLPAAQFAVAVVIGLTAGVAVDRWRARSTLIATNVVRAVVVLLPVLALPWLGLSFPLLVAVAIVLSGLRAIFDPALQSVVPVLVPDRERLQAMNGLLDATFRLARLLGPAIAGFLSLFVAPIHFLTITAATLLGSALALNSIRRRIDTVVPPHPAKPLDAMLAGVRLLRRERVVGFVVLVNALCNAPWFVALNLGAPMLVTEHEPTFLGLQGLAVLGVVLGSYGAGDVVGNLVAGTVRSRRPYRLMFTGYVAMGAGYMGFAAAAWLLSPQAMVPAMMVAAFIAGIGGPFFFVLMVTGIQTTFRGTEIAQVYRFRFALMSGALCLGALSASALFAWLGSTLTVFLSGLAMLLLAAFGMLRLWDEPGRA